MEDEVQNPKATLRKEVRARTRNISAAERAVGSTAARNLLIVQSAWLEARSVLFYAPLPDEVDLWPLVGEG
jgi:5-formyltetrahydrofolate cyclo-ligase